jgi:hypothetical protein
MHSLLQSFELKQNKKERTSDFEHDSIWWTKISWRWLWVAQSRSSWWNIRKSMKSGSGSGSIFIMKFPFLVIHAVITLLLNYHVLHDHIRSYDPPCVLSALCSGMLPNNSPTRLEHMKWPLDIFPHSLLLFNKPTLFLVFGCVGCLHKYGLVRIYTMSQIVLFVIRVSIDLIGGHLSTAFRKSR